MKCRYSPPNLIEWRPLARLTVSLTTYDVSNRPCGSVPGPPKLSAPATIICGSPIARVTPFRMPKSTGLSGRGRKRAAIEAAPAEARFVQERGSEDARRADRQHASRRLRRRSEPGNAVALRRRFERADELTPVEHVEAIVLAGVVLDVDRPAILIGHGRRRSDESRRAVRIEEVRARDQRNQLPNDRIGRRGALRVAQHDAVQVHALTLSEPFVGGEVERPPAPDRAADRSAELVALGSGCGSGVVNSKKLRASSASFRKNSKTSP